VKQMIETGAMNDNENHREARLEQGSSRVLTPAHGQSGHQDGESSTDSSRSRRRFQGAIRRRASKCQLRKPTAAACRGGENDDAYCGRRRWQQSQRAEP
jgi:hypothetical protein